MKSKYNIPHCIPEWLQDEYIKWMDNPKRYETLYSVSAGIIKKYLEKQNEEDQKGSGKQS